MTREEAQNELGNALHHTSYEGIEVINKIYNDFESRTCENCKHRYYEQDGELIKDDYCHMNEQPISDDFGCNRFEPKDA